MDNLSRMSPEVTTEWLVFLLSIRKVPGINFNPDTGYHGGFVFLSPSRHTLGQCRKIGHERLLPYPCNSLFINHDTVTLFKVLSQQMPGSTEENHEKPQ
jgi:hypothetical protein